jgi:hypothetical protein
MLRRPQDATKQQIALTPQAHYRGYQVGGVPPAAQAQQPPRQPAPSSRCAVAPSPTCLARAPPQVLGANVTRYEGGYQRDWNEAIDLYKEELPGPPRVGRGCAGLGWAGLGWEWAGTRLLLVARLVVWPAGQPAVRVFPPQRACRKGRRKPAACQPGGSP